MANSPNDPAQLLASLLEGGQAMMRHFGMRMEVASFAQILFNPVAQAKFVHTVAAGYVTACMFVLGVSSWYLLKARDTNFALRSFAVAAGFGLASALSVIVLGDESGYTTGESQKVKLAAIEAEWTTQKPPASFAVFGIPNDKEQRTDYAIHFPWLLGLIATRSTTEEVKGIKDLKEEHLARIESGLIAYGQLQKLRSGDRSAETRAMFDRHKDDLGFGLLLKKYTPNVVDATPEQKRMAADDTIPQVAPLYWSFRLMVTLGIWFLAIFAAAFYFLAIRNLAAQRWLLLLAFYSIPLPWVAAEAGWIVAEYGRQPWTISGVLPTLLSVSSIPASHVYASLAAFIVFYTGLLIIEMYLMVKYIKLGPGSLRTGRYFGEPAVAVPVLRSGVTSTARSSESDEGQP